MQHLIRIAGQFMCLLFFLTPVYAQPVADSSVYRQELAGLMDVYHRNTGDQSAILNGREYSRYSFYITQGIPFFMSDTLSSGKVMYDGMLQENVPLLYDLVVDQLVTSDITRSNLVILSKLKVTSFSIYGHSFVHLSNLGKGIPDGYYEVLYDGQSRLLKKETKRIIENVKGGENLQRNIESKVSYYVQHNGQYYSVSNLKSLVAVWGKDDKRMKDYLKDNKRSEKTATRDSVLYKAVVFYDQQLP